MSLPAKKPQPPRNNNPQKAPTASHWQGPLPPPESLQQFDSIVEHGAERVFRMAEIEQKHRIESERAALQTNIETVQAEIRTANNGLLLGAAVSVLSIILNSLVDRLPRCVTWWF